MSMLSTFHTAYLAAWLLASLVAVALLIRNRRRYVVFTTAYRRFLFQPWKVATFLIAGVSMTVMAPYTGDPTWDYVDAAFMSVLTFLTASWTVGVLYRAVKMRTSIGETYTAICVWMFSASWSYDLYILLKFGDYPITWASNIFASSVLYLAAGLLWSLDYKEGRGVIFGFMDDDWPNTSSKPGFRKVLWFAIPFMVIAAGMILPFLLPD